MKTEDVMRYIEDHNRQQRTIEISNEPLTIEDYQATLGLLNDENAALRAALKALLEASEGNYIERWDHANRVLMDIL